MRKIRWAIAAITALAVTPFVMANDWDNGSGDAQWSNAVNWSGNIEPNSGTSAIFPAGFPNGDTVIHLSPGENAFLVGFGDNYTLRNPLSIPPLDTATLTLASGVVNASAGKSASIQVRVISDDGLTKNGAGFVTLTRTTTVNGTVAVDDGTLVIGFGGNVACDNGRIASVAGSVGVLTVDGASSQWIISSGLFGGSLLIGDGSGTLNITNGGLVQNSGISILGTTSGSSGVINISGAGSAWTATDVFLSGGGAVGILNIMGGTVTVHTISGGTASTITLDGGTLDLQNQSIGPGGTPIETLNFRSGTLKNVSQINGGAGLTKTTGGTLILEETNTYTGTTTVSAGMLSLATSQQLESLEVSADGHYGVTIGGITPGVDFAQLHLSGNAALAGTLDISLADGFDPQVGDSFVILTFASQSGAFSQITGMSIGAGKEFRIDHHAGDVTLVVVVPTVPGDMNCDGVFDEIDVGPFVLALTDFSAYEQQFSTCEALTGDFNEDLELNGLDIEPYVNCLVNGGCP